MFILWGTYTSKQDRGVVAEACPSCGSLAPCLITDDYSLPHVFFIPCGERRVTGSVRRCLACNAEGDCWAAGYARVLPAKVAGTMNLDELTRQTNPGLARLREARHDAAEAARQDPEEGLRADAFVRDIAPEAPGMGGVIPSLLVTCLMILLVAVLPGFNGMAERVLAAVCLVPAVFVISFAVLVPLCSYRNRKSWLRTRLIPAARGRGVNLEQVAWQLSAVDALDRSSPPQLRRLAACCSLLRRELGMQAAVSANMGAVEGTRHILKRLFEK